jgi:SAM-dependent methyltransferase
VESYVIRGGREGADRLQVLARSWAPTTLALLDRAGLGPGQRCVDLGCGGGDVTLEMAEIVGPTGHVVGVDLDPVTVQVGRERAAARDLTNVEFVVSNLYDWSEPDAYDLAYSRNVLQHLSRPVDLLQAMWAAVRPGGAVVVEDADFEGSFCYPPNAGFDFWVDRYQRVLESHGGDPLSGRKLVGRFVEAGIPDPTVSVVQRADLEDEPKSLPRLTIEATGEAMIQAGIATAAEIDEALLSLSAAATDPTWVFGSPRLFQVWSRRTAAG